MAKMRENELMMSLLTGFKISYSEAGGIKLGRLFTPNLSKGLPCGRTKCQPCGMSQSGKAQNCKARNILYESSCIICNPEDKVKPTNQKKSSKASSHEEDQEQNPKEGKHDVAGPSHQRRVGIYLGESSRSLSERAGEHYRDARDFNKRSHILKHWMNNHREDNVIPPFSQNYLPNESLQFWLSKAITLLLP